jgi:LemA protein
MTASKQSHARRTPPWVRKLVMGAVAAVFSSWLVGCLYYYNIFAAMTSKLASDRSDCEVAMQERHHVTVSLSHVVVAYFTYVQDLLGRITDRRSGQALPLTGSADGAVPALPGSPPSPAVLAKAIEKLGPKELQDLFSRTRLVAEQYPQLRLTENFQQLADAVVEAEHRVAELLIQYNKDVNSYMIVRNKQPGRHFAAVLSFKRIPFMAIDPAGLKFRETTF